MQRLIKTTLQSAALSLSVLLAPLSLQAEESADNVHVLMKTSAGDIELELDRSKAPLSVDNFLTYVESKHYDGTIFHRVIRDFMIQGGGFSADMRQKATLPPIKNEAENGLKNTRGSIAMARTSVIDSATSQFFINVKDNSFLDHGARDFGYAVFGKVVKGMDVVDNIATSPTGARDIPRESILIESVSVISDDNKAEAAEAQ
ncbi:MULTISPECIES: peptidylprolyl isomerase [Thalassolituus]|jgi:peptidyl-prolyl cis-trans isomerase A (cyclophilin A)|uniref:peptidylprolyl isomerase n=1 Tax=Thalassolituus TaxID=187492 RepID=UPI000C4C5D81|nr:peptidylprolyl isomerase [Thalassolituus sp. UBA2009]MAY13894.1 peptidylprolyl isomerase A [Oceanospirillaceae bacterium]PIQ39320.1 MAG: peptidylprolyl isomerase A [Thalassolituus sp. CG17_big_fil_post_rev_8_21_14_2_50_53_8]|tara:strand:- start:624 stop:1232 length:609 start_codon:yes stop_codon:yes gene_type:complete